MADSVTVISVDQLPTEDAPVVAGFESVDGRMPLAGDKVIARAGDESIAVVVASIDQEAQTVTVTIPRPSNSI